MQPIKLAKCAVDALSVSSGDAVVWDRDIPEFGVRVHASGCKVWCVWARRQSGKSKRNALGNCGEVVPDQARPAAFPAPGDAGTHGDRSCQTLSGVSCQGQSNRVTRRHGSTDLVCNVGISCMTGFPGERFRGLRPPVVGQRVEAALHRGQDVSRRPATVWKTLGADRRYRQASGCVGCCTAPSPRTASGSDGFGSGTPWPAPYRPVPARTLHEHREVGEVCDTGGGEACMDDAQQASPVFPAVKAASESRQQASRPLIAAFAGDPRTSSTHAVQ